MTAEADAADELRKLVRDAKDWQQQRRGLLRQPELGVFRQWRDAAGPVAGLGRAIRLGRRIRLGGSLSGREPQQEQREQREKEEARQRELKLVRRRAAIAMTIAAVAIISLAFAAWLSVRLADSNRRQTEVLVKATVAAPDENFPSACRRPASVSSRRPCSAAGDHRGPETTGRPEGKRGVGAGRV